MLRDMPNNKRVLLISVYIPKSLSVKHMETALTHAGYDVTVVYFKNINFSNPKNASERELELLKDLVKEKNPCAIGVSVMASFFMETIELVNNMLKKEFGIPMVWGGIYPTMFPEKCMELADFVVRGEGEEAFIELLDALGNETGDYAEIKNLVYREADGTIKINDLRDLLTDLDKFGLPVVGKDNKYLINDDVIKNRDPLLDDSSYEISGSRGCPHACSYCCSSTVKQINAGKGKVVRFRELDKVIEELVHAKSKMKKIKYIRFYDEIFPDDEAWVEEFTSRYKKEINLPFEVWGHPLRTKENVMKKLRSVGLYKVSMGMQSGSPYIRRKIFHRPEKQEDIINASRAMANAGVPEMVYDLMVRHCFESHETLWETVELCLELTPPFELQLHGLNFLPGTPIVKKALDMNLVTPEDMERLMHAPMREQFVMYWKNENSDEKMNYIYKLLYLTQLSCYRKKVRELADPNAPEQYEKVDRMYKRAMRLVRIRHIYMKFMMLAEGTMKRMFG